MFDWCVKIYICSSYTVSPVVQSKTLVFQEHSESRTLECNVTGVPHIYTFSKWQHYTCNNTWIRSLEGNASGTLILAEKDPEDVRFEDGGIYICNVTNGIPDDNNNLWTTGKVEVIVKGKSVVLIFNYTWRCRIFVNVIETF